jgi:HK97 family phage major capsid protein
MDKKALMQKALLDARAICDLAEKEKRDFTGEERTKVEQLLTDAKKLKDEIKAQEGDEALRKAIMDLGAGIELNDRPRTGPQPGAPAGKGQTIGEQFVSSDSWKAFLAQFPNGHIPDSAKGLRSNPIHIGGMKQLIAGADVTSAGAFVNPDFTGIYEPLGRYPLNVLGLVARRTTTSDTVEFVRQTRQVTEAAPTPEANVKYPTGATGEITGTKPQGHMNFEKVYETVKTIAVYVGATKRALSDAAQIRGIIDQELRDDVQEELELQIVNGNGIGENFTGIFNTANVLIQPFITNVFVTARNAMTSVQVNGRATPTAWVINPIDWANIELTPDLTGRLYYNGPLNTGPKTLWGLPVVESLSVPQGTGLLGDWRKAVLWDREQATVTATDSHSDWFIRNLVAILCELRAAFGLIRPTAFCQVLWA